MEAFNKEGDGGLSWADQWDYKFNDKERLEAEKRERKKNRVNGEGLGGKIKDAASSGMDKAKVVAQVGAQKIKSGTTSGVQWIKDKCQKQKAKKAGP